jgi:hypothetical protein
LVGVVSEKERGMRWWERLVSTRYERTLYEFADLAQYNSEKARGIVHTPEWNKKMAKEQARFNANREAM